MSVNLNPYLNFKDNTREAMEFYHSIFGGKLDMNTFGDFHATEDPAETDKIMHAQLEGDNGIVFMAADTPGHMDYKPGTNFSMSLSGDDAAMLKDWFAKLTEGGTVIMPVGKSPWGDEFGMGHDKFGVSWLVNITGQQAATKEA